MMIMQVHVILAQTKIFIWTFEAMEISQRLLPFSQIPCKSGTPPSFEMTIPISNSFPEHKGNDASFCNKQ